MGTDLESLRKFQQAKGLEGSVPGEAKETRLCGRMEAAFGNE